MKFTRKLGRKRAISAVVGALVMVAVTLAVGFAVWAWARSAAQSAEKNFGSAINGNIQCLNQNFVITNANFSSSNFKLVTVWFYNNGNGTVSISLTTISNSTWTYTNSTTFAVKQSSILPVLFNVKTSLTVGSLYTFKSVARCQGDLIATYQQVR